MFTFKKPILWTLILGSSALFNACEDHDHDDDHKHDEGELINQVVLEFTQPNDTSANFSVFWSDLDGIGGTDPILPDTAHLIKDSTYEVRVKFYHVHDGKTEDLTTEILEEAAEHIICFSHTSMATVQYVEIVRKDKDKNNLELGLESTWKGLLVHDGAIQVALKHQPGIKNGTCSIGETDVEVIFPISVK